MKHHQAKQIWAQSRFFGTEMTQLHTLGVSKLGILISVDKQLLIILMAREVRVDPNTQMTFFEQLIEI
ncbi:hypothetical protein AL543_03530 [Vibrio mimicus]|nr:hypothetical protein AL543_03530 [Vibrio mimicus]KAA3493968.1 hypothetical protein Y058_01525 [Vibrio mimicus]